jgi:hypothetical protein
MNRVQIRSFQRATIPLAIGLLILSGCQPTYEFTVVQGNNTAILTRVSNLLVAEGFKPISQFSPDPRTNGCRVVDQDGAFSKQTHARPASRSFSVTYVICDGRLRLNVSSSDTDSLSDHYERELVNVLRHELEGEIAAGQVIVRTKQYVALGP